MQLWNACGSSSVRRLTGGHNTRSDRSQDYNQEDTQGAAFCQQLVVSHPVRAFLPLRGIPGHCCQPRDRVPRHKDRGPCTNIPLDSLTSQHQLFHWHFTAHAPKPNLVFLAPIHSTEPSNKKMLVEEISFSFGLSAGRKTVKFTVRSHRQVGRRGQTRLNDHLNPECITID